MNRSKQKAALKTACVAGVLVLLLFLCLTLGTSFLAGKGVFPAPKSGSPADFYDKLQLLDNVLSMEGVNGGLNHVHAGNLLAELQKSAVGAEAWLSLLKRYRALAKEFPRYAETYRAATGLARGKYPHSALIAALSAEAVAADADASAGVRAAENVKAARLLGESGPLSAASFFPLAFCLYAAADSFDTPASALAVDRVEALFDAFTGARRDASGGGLAERAREAMLVDAALLKILDGRIAEAAAGLARLDPRRVLRPETASFIASYSFDFANLRVAAELWAKTGSEKDLSRAASALYLAGETEEARRLWLMLAENVSDGGESIRGEAASRDKVLYNLAATSAGDGEKARFLEQLLAGSENGEYDRATVNMGLVMYTRLLPEDRVRAILAGYPFTGVSALLDLEYLRRRLETMPPDRVVAETWLLLNRHPADERIYRWAAWFFEYQRRYEDLSALQHFAAQNRVESPALAFHRALQLVRDGNIKEGASLLESAGGIPAWQRYANMARLLYARREFAASLRCWEDAAAMLPADASPFLRAAGARIYLWMAQCRRVQGGKPEDVRRDLERAYALDSENIDVRLSLRKLAPR
ncbi:MAG: hypothetical protein LBO04_05640 [Spirochaetaceae bacterium]|nr:hypothetical protein [Spirochaetaceae bacterium]